VQTVREKMTCRDCEAITQPPAPSHPIARGRAGPELLAEVLSNKYGAHLPLNRQSQMFAREGVDLDVSTMADWVGAAAATLMPLRDSIEKHVHVAERLHVDDTTVPVLAKGKCRTGRLCTHVRDDRPFGGKAAPAAVFYYSPTREGEHAERQLASYTGIVQADAYSGFNGLFVEGRQVDGLPGPIVEAGCWSHSRRKFFELARLRKMPRPSPVGRRVGINDNDFRGLLRLHTRYGPPDRSTAQGGLCHEASTQPVTQPRCPSATRSIDNALGGTFLHSHSAPSGRTRKLH